LTLTTSKPKLTSPSEISSVRICAIGGVSPPLWAFGFGEKEAVGEVFAVEV
jgi:hypothetical protein